jgi:hypothetical protein
MARTNSAVRNAGHWIVKAPVVLKEKFDEIARQRVISGRDKKTVPYSRLLLAASRHEKFLSDLKIADLREDKRAQFSVFSIFTFIISALLVVLLFGGWIYITGLLNTTFHDVGVLNEGNAGQAGYTNMTLAADQTFGVMNNGIQALRMVAAVYILALAVCIIITNALIKLHPMWFFAYMLISFLAIIFSAPISNAYQTLLASGIYGGGLTQFTLSNFVLLNLPTLVMFITIFGGIFLFINMLRAGNEGNLQ